MKRNHFLLGAVSGLTALASFDSLFGKALVKPRLPGFSGGVDDHVLVIIYLRGGNDGLNTIVPHGMDHYYRLRPSLAIPRDTVLRIDDQIGLHPVMTSLKGMFDAGEVAIVQGVGYPNPDHSHSRSLEVWQTAIRDGFQRTGWLGRYLDEANLSKQNLFNAIALTPVLPEVLVAQNNDVPAIPSVDDYHLTYGGNGGKVFAPSLVGENDRVPFDSPYFDMVKEIGEHARRGSETFKKLLVEYDNEASYPFTPLGHSLALTAKIIKSWLLGTRIIYVELASFDTHAVQKDKHPMLLAELSNAVKVFYDDLQTSGNDKRTLTMIFSEFGRRVAENASLGTDHGEAGPLLLVGGGVKGGIYGKHPSLDDLDYGDLKYSVDFRSVYATVIEQWLGRPSHDILLGSYPTMSMFG